MSAIDKNMRIWIGFLPVFIVYQLFLWPVLITNDGTTYLSSAIALFSDNMSSEYYWIREPGYPLFLKFILLFESYSGVVLIILQSCFLYFSFFISNLISKEIFNFKENSRISYIFIFTLFISGYFISYGSIVLQQSILSFLLTLILYQILYFNKKLSKRQILAGIILYILISIITVNFLYIYLYIQFFVSLLVGYGIVKYSSKLELSLLKKFNYTLFISITLIFIQYAASLPWDSIKNNSLQSSFVFTPVSMVRSMGETNILDISVNKNVIVNDIAEESEAWAGTEFPSPLEFIKSESFLNPSPNYLERFLSFFSLYEPRINNLWKENQFFIDTQLSNRAAGSHLISAGWQPYLDNALKVQPINQSSMNQILNFSSAFRDFFLKFNLLLYQLMSILFLSISTYLIIIKKNTKYLKIFMIALVSAIPYLMTWPVDRYSIPLYPLMVAVVIGFFYSRFSQSNTFFERKITHSFLTKSTRIITLFLLSIYLLNLSFFQNNDDVLVFSISDGTLYGLKDDFLIYPSTIIGKILTELYTFTEIVNWYFILLVATQISAIFLTLNYLSQRIKQQKEFLLLILLLIFGSIIFFSLQYTQTAILTSGLASIIFLSSRIKHEKILSAILIVVATLWRFEAAILGFVTVFAIYLIFKRKEIINKTSLLFISVGIFSFLVNSLSINLLTFSEDETKKDFYRFNSARESVQGFEPIANTDNYLFKAAKSVGWSKNDYALSQRKSYASEKEIFNTTNYEYIADQRYTNMDFDFVIEILKNYISIIYENYLIYVFFIFLFTLVLYNIYSRIKVYEILAYFILLNIIFISVLFLGKLPERIFWPLAIISLFSIFAITLSREPSRNSYQIEDLIKLKSVFSLLLLVLFLNISNYFNLIKEEYWWKSTVNNKDKGFERLANFETDKPIIAFSSFYSPIFKTANPHSGPALLPQIRKDLIIVGWVNQSPSYQKNLVDLGLTADLFTSIAYGDAYLAIGQIEELQMVNQYLREHKNIEVEWPVAPFVFSDTGLGIWKVEGYKYID